MPGGGGVDLPSLCVVSSHTWIGSLLDTAVHCVVSCPRVLGVLRFLTTQRTALFSARVQAGQGSRPRRIASFTPSALSL